MLGRAFLSAWLAFAVIVAAATGARATDSPLRLPSAEQLKEAAAAKNGAPDAPAGWWAISAYSVFF